MAGNYNTRPMAAEVMVSDSQYALIRERQPTESLWELERRADFD